MCVNFCDVSTQFDLCVCAFVCLWICFSNLKNAHFVRLCGSPSHNARQFSIIISTLIFSASSSISISHFIRIIATHFHMKFFFPKKITFISFHRNSCEQNWSFEFDGFVCCCAGFNRGFIVSAITVKEKEFIAHLLMCSFVSFSVDWYEVKKNESYSSNNNNSDYTDAAAVTTAN